MLSEAPWNRLAVVLFAAIAGAFGSGVGGLMGGTGGATLMGALAAMAIVVATATHVSTVTAARAAAAAAVASAIGFVSNDLPALPLPAGDVGGDLWSDISRRCGSSAARGALQIAWPATFIGIALRGHSVARFGPMLLGAVLVGAWWWSDRIVAALPPSLESGLTSIVLSSAPVAEKRPQVAAWCAATLVFLFLLGWVRFVQDNRLAFRLGLWGVVAGGLAFGFAEAISSAPMWLPATAIATRLKEWLVRVPMDHLRAIGQGFVWGGMLGWAAHRERVAFASTPDTGSLRAPWEFGLIAMHTVILMAAHFTTQAGGHGLLEAYFHSGLVVAALPLVCSLTGRRVPWMVLLPMALAPMVGSALQHAVYDAKSLGADVGWVAVVAVPIGVACATAAWAITRDEEEPAGRPIVPLGLALVVSVATAAGLSAALLDFSWPWRNPTPHTGTLTVLGALATMLVIAAVRAMSVARSDTTSRLPAGTTRT